jgi:hypothetical protein
MNPSSKNLILFNANVLTLDPHFLRADWVAVCDGNPALRVPSRAASEQLIIRVLPALASPVENLTVVLFLVNNYL